MASSFPCKHVLVWVDGTDAANRALQAAVGIAKNSRARLTAVAVVDTETLNLLLKQKFLVHDEMLAFEKELAVSSENYLHAAQESAKKEGVRVDTVLLQGACHSAILREQEKRGADLIVMGNFSAEDIRRDLTARGRQLLLDSAKVPVLIVP
jgi:nucleotide-binding universal stress UspA family protein